MALIAAGSRSGIRTATWTAVPFFDTTSVPSAAEKIASAPRPSTFSMPPAFWSSEGLERGEHADGLVAAPDREHDLRAVVRGSVAAQARRGVHRDRGRRHPRGAGGLLHIGLGQQLARLRRPALTGGPYAGRRRRRGLGRVGSHDLGGFGGDVGGLGGGAAG